MPAQTRRKSGDHVGNGVPPLEWDLYVDSSAVVKLRALRAACKSWRSNPSQEFMQAAVQLASSGVVSHGSLKNILLEFVNIDQVGLVWMQPCLAGWGRFHSCVAHSIQASTALRCCNGSTLSVRPSSKPPAPTRV